MIPRILEYEEGRIRITENAFMQPELKAIMDKHEPNSEPYLAYVHLWTAPDSPYINIPEEQRDEMIVYDLIMTFGNFDSSDPILQPAIDKLKRLYTSPLREYFLESQEELHRIKTYLSTNALTDDMIKVRFDIFNKGAAVATAYKKLEKEADEELQQRLRGSAELGMY